MIGGADNDRFFNQNEIFEVSFANDWWSLKSTMLPQLSEPRQGASCFILRDYLFVAFGKSKNLMYAQSLEAINLKTSDHLILSLENAYDYFSDSIFLVDSNKDENHILNSKNRDELIFYS